MLPAVEGYGRGDVMTFETATMTAAQLREWREAHGLTQEKLARILGVTMNTVWRWEAEGTPNVRAVPPFLGLALREIERQLVVER